MDTKYCKKCKQNKEHWYKSDGSACRDCHRAYRRAWAKAHYVPVVRKPYSQPKHLQPTRIPTEQDWAWFAGFYEGEGSVNKSGLQVAQKDLWPLTWCRERFGGRIAKYLRKKDGLHYYKWWLTGPTCRAVLRKIEPLLSPRRKGQLRILLRESARGT